MVIDHSCGGNNACAYALWVLLFIPAFVFTIRSLFKKKSEIQHPEWISLCGFIFPFIALSFSNYKLPHYIFPLFPFAAIITSNFLMNYAEKFPRWFEITYMAYMHLFVL